MRFVAGDPAFGREVETLPRRLRVERRAVGHGRGAAPAECVQVTELVPSGRFNVKLSRGGLVDVE
jgi:glutamine synthetase adenylyltransferase